MWQQLLGSQELISRPGEGAADEPRRAALSRWLSLCRAESLLLPPLLGIPAGAGGHRPWPLGDAARQAGAEAEAEKGVATACFTLLLSSFTAALSSLVATSTRISLTQTLYKLRN